MYQGKHIAPKKRTGLCKPLAVLASTALLLCAIAGGTLAWLTDTSNAVENTFTPGRVTCSIDESFNGTTKEHVTVKNTGNTDAFIRARIIVSWKNGAGEIYGTEPVLGADYQIGIGSGWQQVGQYYYYLQSVAPEASTTDLITSCQKLDGAKVPAGFDLSVEIIADAIQSDPITAVKTAWPEAPVAR